MKWFIKVFRHYADFSGRARRQELWMFVLFNTISVFVLSMVAAIIVMGTTGLNNEQVTKLLTNIVTRYYVAVTFLPAMAVVARRLHDQDKSAWWMLIGLIPFVGWVWIFVLMCIAGDNGKNQYGQDPKTSPETFSKPKRLKSAGIVLIVTSSIFIVTHLNAVSESPIEVFPLSEILFYLACILFLSAGIFMLNISNNNTIQTKLKNALYILMAAFALFFFLDFVGFMNIGGAYLLFDCIGLFMLLLLVVLLLFTPDQKTLISIPAITAIIFTAMSLFMIVYNTIYDVFINRIEVHYNNFVLLLPVAYIILAATLPGILNGEDETPAEDEEEDGEDIKMQHNEHEFSGNYALLHIYRPSSFKGAMISFKVNLDDKMLGRMTNKSKMTVTVTDAGQQILWAKTEAKTKLPIDIEFGKEYYIKCKIGMGFFVGRPKMELVDSNTGKDEFELIN